MQNSSRIAYYDAELVNDCFPTLPFGHIVNLLGIVRQAGIIDTHLTISKGINDELLILSIHLIQARTFSSKWFKTQLRQKIYVSQEARENACRYFSLYKYNASHVLQIIPAVQNHFISVQR